MAKEGIFEFNDQEVMPYSLEAEQSVLGGLLIDSSAMGEVLKYIKAKCFFRAQHKEIFEIMQNMFVSGKSIDFVTVYDEVAGRNVFDTPENAKVYMARLMEMVPSVSNIHVYAKIVQEKYYLRHLILTSREISSSAQEGGSDAKTVLDMAEQKIFEIRQGRDASGLVPISEVIDKEYQHLGQITGPESEKFKPLSSGFSALDTVISGLNPSDLVLIAARPGMGKTSFALNIAVNVAKASRKKVAIFSLEMSNQQLIERILSSEARVPSNKLHVGDLSADDWTALAAGVQNLYNAPLYFDDTSGINVAEIKAKLRRMENLGLVVIDYLQLMSSGGNENRVQAVSEMTRNLKIMAKELDVPVVTLSQLARGPERRENHRPMLADLRESGSIEQDADIVMFLYRDDYYNPESEEVGVAECIVSKNRHGETGTVKLAWNGQFTKFTGLDYTHYDG